MVTIGGRPEAFGLFPSRDFLKGQSMPKTLYGFDLKADAQVYPLRVWADDSNGVEEWALYPGPGQWTATKAAGKTARVWNGWVLLDDDVGVTWVRLRCFPISSVKTMAPNTEIAVKVRNAMGVEVEGVAVVLGSRQMSGDTRPAVDLAASGTGPGFRSFRVQA